VLPWPRCGGYDASNAMTSDRFYRKAMPLEDAIAELRRVRGAQFDPQVVDALIEAVGDGVAEAQIENVA
jgi:HD-GYP domain-containing protein (c-di-GMP phosphodiesterase class II)